ncbi:MAG: iron-sulfur cluster repair di-iron protein [Thermoanaerobaculia bacterium]
MEEMVTRTVGEIAAAIPASTRVFEKLGIDYCCGGHRSLVDACSAAKISVDYVRGMLEATTMGPAESTTADAWAKKDLRELITHIVTTHHRFTRDELERLDALVAKVVGVHGTNHPELRKIAQVFARLREDLLPHMMKEEDILFPFVEQMESALESGDAPPPPFFGTVKNPVRMMMMEHDAAGDMIRELRTLSNDFTPPEDGCMSYRTLYSALADFEADLHQHIHLENNILFPRSIEMEERGEV